MRGKDVYKAAFFAPIFNPIVSFFCASTTNKRVDMKTSVSESTLTEFAFQIITMLHILNDMFHWNLKFYFIGGCRCRFDGMRRLCPIPGWF